TAVGISTPVLVETPAETSVVESPLETPAAAEAVGFWAAGSVGVGYKHFKCLIITPCAEPAIVTTCFHISSMSFPWINSLYNSSTTLHFVAFLLVHTLS